MPVHCALKQGKWRVCETGGRIATNNAGTALDGGGHDSESACQRQARAVNANVQRSLKEVPLTAFVDKLPKEQRDALVAEGADVKVTRAWAGELKDVEDAGKRRATFYISTRHLDHDKDIMLPEGADLSVYQLNPVMLWAHDYSGLPLAKAVKIASDGIGVLGTFDFADTPFALDAWRLVETGFLKTLSPGFRVREAFTRADGKVFTDVMDGFAKAWPEFTDAVRDNVVRVITKWLLLETSLCAVPAQPRALLQEIGKGHIVIGDDLRKRMKLDELALAEEEAEKATPPPPPPPEPRYVRVVSEAQSIRQIVTEGQLKEAVAAAVKRTLDTLRGRMA